MILSRRVSFHDAQLDQVAPEIVITGTDRGTAKENVTAVDRMGGFGQRVTSSHWQTLEASVTFAIDVPKSNPRRRVQVFELVRAWAVGTTGTGLPENPWLKMHYSGRKVSSVTVVGGIGNTNTANVQDNFANQRMYVDKVVFPGSADMFDWTKEYTITFRAYNVPFWQDVTPASGSYGLTNPSAGGSGKGASLNVGGNILTPVNAEFWNRSGKKIDNINIWTDVSSINLTGLNLGGSGRLSIYHETNGLMSIMADGVSVYSNYTGSDDLLIKPGSNKVYYSADRAGTFTAEAFGRYL